MVEYQGDVLDRVFGALAHPARRAIVARLRTGQATVTELAAPFEMSLNAVSKHLMVLEDAGLLRREIVGREHRCTLNAAPLADASGWVEEYREFWEARLESLEAFLVRKKNRKSRDS
jgi:DNA-binding transcriptional ArsR family regulator